MFISRVKNGLYFSISTFRTMRAMPNMAVFADPKFRALPVCCSGIVCVILK